MSKIKFASVFISYIFVLWIMPLFIFNVDNFFIGLQNILSVIGLGVLNSFLFYFIFIIPAISILIKVFLLKDYSRLFFWISFIVIPYVILISFLGYGYYHLFDNFSPF